MKMLILKDQVVNAMMEAVKETLGVQLTKIDEQTRYMNCDEDETIFTTSAVWCYFAKTCAFKYENDDICVVAYADCREIHVTVKKAGLICDEKNYQTEEL